MTGGAADERGSATIWVVACCALLMMVAGVVTVRSLAVLARHRAEASADLAALAAAGQIGVGDAECAAAGRVAGRNGGRLRSCSVHLAPDGRSGTVSVSVAMPVTLPVAGTREVVATARAARLRAAPAGPRRLHPTAGVRRMVSTPADRPGQLGCAAWTLRSRTRPRAASPS